MLFYLTTLNLVRFLIEGETYIQVVNVIDAWKAFDFLCKNYVMSGMHDSFYNVYYTIKMAKEL